MAPGPALGALRGCGAPLLHRVLRQPAALLLRGGVRCATIPARFKRSGTVRGQVGESVPYDANKLAAFLQKWGDTRTKVRLTVEEHTLAVQQAIEQRFRSELEDIRGGATEPWIYDGQVVVACVDHKLRCLFMTTAVMGAVAKTESYLKTLRDCVTRVRNIPTTLRPVVETAANGGSFAVVPLVQYSELSEARSKMRELRGVLDPLKTRSKVSDYFSELELEAAIATAQEAFEVEYSEKVAPLRYYPGVPSMYAMPLLYVLVDRKTNEHLELGVTLKTTVVDRYLNAGPVALRLLEGSVAPGSSITSTQKRLAAHLAKSREVVPVPVAQLPEKHDDVLRFIEGNRLVLQNLFSGLPVGLRVFNSSLARDTGGYKLAVSI